MAYLKRLFGHIFFSDITPLIQRGAKHPLTSEDMPALLPSLDPRHNLLHETQIDWSDGSRILKTLLFSDRRLWVAPSLFYAINATLSLAGPVLVNLFVKRLQAGLATPEAVTQAVVYGLAIGLSGIAAGLCMQHYFLRQLRRGQMFVNLINTKVFRHALDLTKQARDTIPIGDIVNHLSTDTDSIAEVANALSDLVWCTFMITGAVGLLFYYLGSTAWIALALLTLLGPITKSVSRNFVRFEEDLMRHRDRRVTLMSQILGAIRLVKYFAWESSVRQEVAVLRNEELRARERIAQAELTVTMIYVSVGTLVLFAVLAWHSGRGGVFDPALTFTCVSLFSLLEDPFAFIAKVISTFINAKVGANRIADFLRQPRLEWRPGRSLDNFAPVGFRMQNFSAFLGSKKFLGLRDVSLALAPGQSLAIVGAVGSGKSTLLQALLGEVELSEGLIQYHQAVGQVCDHFRIGYVPQEAFILNGTLRENLTFGRQDCRTEEIAHAVELASLKDDLARIPGGLETEIGEKGINLSGGQRQRLSLARAVLHRPQLVLLDDPLSAVDATTEDFLVKHLLFGEWRDVTKVMVTHRLSALVKFDQIAFLKQGELKGVGSFLKLSEECPEFRAFLQEGHEAPAPAAAVTESPGESSTAEAAQRITEDEERALGAVRGGIYWDYIASLGGESVRARPWILALLALAAVSGTFFPLLQKGWLARMSNVQGCKTCTVSTGLLETWAVHPLSAILVYGVLGLLVMAATLAADLFWLKRGLKAGRNIHDRMLDSVLGAKLRFFDSTPVGRILQRFSRDMEAVDVQLQWSFETSMKCLAQVLLTLALIVVALPWIVLGLVPVLYSYYRVQKLYRASAREAKRLDSIARSPRYAHFKETLQGLMVIRAYGRREWFLQEFYRRLAHSQRMFCGHYLTNRWFSTRVPVIGGLVSLFTALGIVASVRYETLSPGMAGLLTVYSLSFWGVLNWGIRIWSEVEARMTSMERLRYYSRLTPEAHTASRVPLPVDWPAHGRVQFENVSARYASHLPLVLKGLSFQIRPGERVGIVGRTGSGKSTIFQVLYRFLEIEKGSVQIDGVDIQNVPLDRLRKCMAIIPQDPTLFLGTVRSNLDRYHCFSDEQIWRVLERTALSDFVRQLPMQLESPCQENGANFSQGQRQLLCLARALLMDAKVIIVDEATASVDVQTDAKVQAVLREACCGITMLIIAHRLKTVKDCDQILEIQAGILRPRGDASEALSGDVLT